MFKMMSFRSDGAFWPLAEPPETEAGRSWLGRLSIGLLALPRRIAAELAIRRAVQSLADLDERTLRDIGIDRSQIPSAARHGRYAVTSWETDLDPMRWSRW